MPLLWSRNPLRTWAFIGRAPRAAPWGRKGQGAGWQKGTSSPDQPSGVLSSWNDPSEVSQVGSEGWDLSHRPRTAEGTHGGWGSKAPSRMGPGQSVLGDESCSFANYTSKCS